MSSHTISPGNDEHAYWKKFLDHRTDPEHRSIHILDNDQMESEIIPYTNFYMCAFVCEIDIISMYVLIKQIQIYIFLLYNNSNISTF